MTRLAHAVSITADSCEQVPPSPLPSSRRFDSVRESKDNCVVASLWFESFLASDLQ